MRVLTVFLAALMTAVTLLAAPALAAPASPTLAGPASACGAPGSSPTIELSGTSAPADGEEVSIRVYRASDEVPVASDVPVEEDGAWTASVDLPDGEHELTAVAYDAVADLESDPSDPITVSIDAAARLGSLTARPATISPKNKDGVKDATALSVAASSPGTVRFMIMDGATVVRPFSSASLAAGEVYTKNWNGRGSSSYNGRAFVRGGAYQVRAMWTRDGCPSVSKLTTVTIDNGAPTVSSLWPKPRTFYPKENDAFIEYKDTISLKYSGLSEPAGVKVMIYRDGARKPIRSWSVGFDGNGGSGSTTWNGRRKDGSLAPAGTYEFRFRFRDRVGNIRKTARVGFHLSHKRLVARTTAITKNGDAFSTWATNSACGDISGWGSDYARGVFVDVWDCDYSTWELTTVDYRFRVPGAAYHHSVKPAVYGHSDEFSNLYAIMYDYRARDWDGVGSASPWERWHWYSGRSASKFVRSDGQVRLSLAVVEDDTINGYDIGAVKLKVRYAVLKA